MTFQKYIKIGFKRDTTFKNPLINKEKAGSRITLFFYILLSLSPPLVAVDTSFWEISTYESFLQGALENISLSRDGRLRPSPSTKSIFEPDETLVLSLALDNEGALYFGTGHQGKVFRINEEGIGELLFVAPEPDIFSLAVGPDGDLYVAEWLIGGRFTKLTKT